MPENFIFHAPTRLVFGPGSVAQVGAEAGGLGLHRVLIVTGRGPTRASAGLAALRGSLEAAGIASLLYAEVGHDPDALAVEACAAAIVEAGADAVLAYGGGSPIDCAKAASVYAANSLLAASPLPGRAWLDFVYGRAQFARPGLPLIAVPTTAGSGSEMSNAAVTIDPAAGRKLGLSSVFFFPRLALVDPEVQATMPASLAAATGMDALTHAVESFVSRRSTPLTRSIAGEAARLILRSLAPACLGGVAEAERAGARSEMGLASSMVALAFSHTGLGMVHGFAHPVGARGGLAHGLANAVILPHVVEACARTEPAPFAALALAAGLGGAALVGGAPGGVVLEGGAARDGAASQAALDGAALDCAASRAARDGAARLLEAIRALEARLGIPKGLGELGLSRDLLPAILEDARGYRNRAASPRLFSDEELAALLEGLY